VAALLHDYELTRIWSKKEHPGWIALKICVYIYYVTAITLAIIYKTEKLFTMANLSLVFVPAFTMLYSSMLFKYKGNRRRPSRENAVQDDNPEGIGAIPEDAILQRLHQAQHR
jgi:amino acid transporter